MAWWKWWLLAIFSGMWGRAATDPETGSLGFQIVALTLFGISITKIYRQVAWILRELASRRRESERPDSVVHTEIRP